MNDRVTEQPREQREKERNIERLLHNLKTLANIETIHWFQHCHEYKRKCIDLLTIQCHFYKTIITNSNFFEAELHRALLQIYVKTCFSINLKLGIILLVVHYEKKNIILHEKKFNLRILILSIMFFVIHLFFTIAF